MSKKVLVFSGSPRKGGNSDMLCDQLVKGAQEAGHEVEKISLREQKINYCTGCGVCNQTHQCVQQDSMAAILAKMVTADVFVMASPVYFYSIDAQMKTLIDRVVPRYTELTGKEMYYIITAADTNISMMQRAIECFRGFAQCLPGAQEKGIVYGVGAWQKGAIQKTPAMQQAYEMGKNI